MRAQGALEYLIIIAAVLGISAVVVVFVTGALTGSSGGADISKCRVAAANCQKDLATGLSSTCPYCNTACVDSSGKDLLGGTLGCGTACEQCKQGTPVGGGSSPSIGLLNYWKMDEGIGTSIGSSTGGYTGSLSGMVPWNFESVMDGFTADCTSPSTAYVPGRIGTGIQLWSTSNVDKACIFKSLGSVKPPGYTIWFYGKGYVRGGIWNGSKMVSYTTDVDAVCSTPANEIDVYSYCNGGNPYSDWKLFRMTVAENSIITPSIFLYSKQASLGDTYAGYYDYVTDGPVWVDRGLGKALRFDGYDDYVLTPYNGIFLQNMTVSVWFNVNSWDWIAALGRFHNVGGIDQGWMLYRNQPWSVGQLGWYFNYNTTTGTAAVALPSYMGLSANTWYHAAATIYSNGSYITYLNGVPYTSLLSAANFAKWGGTNPNANVKMTIGRGSDATAYWMNGAVDEVRVYDRVLTAPEIAQIYSGG